MKRIPIFVLPLAFVGAVATLPEGSLAALAGDAAAGKRVYDASCTGCHDTGVHARKERTVHSLDELRRQLGNCEHMAGKQFTEAQTQDLVKYLNDSFYHFP